MQTLSDFYNDERRRESREVRFGTEWTTSKSEDFRYSVFWLDDTNELCVMRSPIGGIYFSGHYRNPIDPFLTHAEVLPLADEDLVIEVLAQVDEKDAQALLDGWEAHEKEKDGLEWVKARVRRT